MFRNDPLIGGISPALVCRPALPMDTPTVMEMVRTIWDGEDYIPSVWQSWLEDPRGLLVVAELAGQLVGLARLTLLTPAQAWMEGMRVYPPLQGQGIASHLHDYLLDYWLRIYSSHPGAVLRLITNAKRKAVQHLCERTGFHKRAEYVPYQASILAEPCPVFEPLGAGEIPLACERARQNPALPPSLRLVDLSWQWAEPEECLLEAAVAEKKAWWWRGREGLLTIVEDRETNEKIPYIGLVVCQPERLADLLGDYRRLAALLGYAQVNWWAPTYAPAEQALLSAGFTLAWDGSIYLYEKWPGTE